MLVFIKLSPKYKLMESWSIFHNYRMIWFKWIYMAAFGMSVCPFFHAHFQSHNFFRFCLIDLDLNIPGQVIPCNHPKNQKIRYQFHLRIKIFQNWPEIFRSRSITKNWRRCRQWPSKKDKITSQMLPASVSFHDSVANCECESNATQAGNGLLRRPGRSNEREREQPQVQETLLEPCLSWD